MADRPAAAPDWLTLDADERVLLRTNPSTNLVLASLVGGMTVMLVMAVVVGFVTDHATGRILSFVVLVGIVLLISWAYVMTKRREYIVTSERVCAAVGFTGKRVRECPLEVVRDVTVERAVWQQLFRVGTVRLVSSDGEIRFGHVGHPIQIQQYVLQFVDDVR